MVPGTRFISTKGACTISFLTVLFTQFANRTPVYRHHRAPAPLLVTIPTYRSLRAISISDNILTIHVEVILQRRPARNDGYWYQVCHCEYLSLFVLTPTRFANQRNGAMFAQPYPSVPALHPHRRPTLPHTDG